MNNKIFRRIGVAVIALILLSTSFIFGTVVGKNKKTDSKDGSLQFILDAYSKYYYNAEDDILNAVTKGLMDEYSEYYDEKSYNSMLNSIAGERYSFGLSVDNDLNIVRIAYNSPCELAGMETGGRVISIGDRVLTDYKSFQDSFSVDVNDLTFKVDYNGVERLFTVRKAAYTETFVRFYDGQKLYGYRGENNISRYETDCSAIKGVELKSGYSYLEFKSFLGAGGNGTDEWENNISTSLGQFKDALELFKKGANRNLILDLRGNGGGYVSLMGACVSYFVEGADSVVTQICVEKDNAKSLMYSPKCKNGEYNAQKIIILADGNTASASEAFIGALLCYDELDKVQVVVEYNSKRDNYSTFGKGVMQRTIVSKDGKQAVKLTTARVFWPKDDITVNGTGVYPELYGNIFASKNGDNQPIDALLYVNSYL